MILVFRFALHLTVGIDSRLERPSQPVTILTKGAGGRIFIHVHIQFGDLNATRAVLRAMLVLPKHRSNLASDALT